MNHSLRLPWLLWLLGLAIFVAVALFPLSTGVTRAAGLLLFLTLWLGLILLGWRRPPLRYALLAFTVLALVFVSSPARSSPSGETLRRDYVNAMRRYEGVPYVWGGESPKGIDCSGLIRRGMIDALACRGVRDLNPGLIRKAFGLWWHDATASAFGEISSGLTVPLEETSSINQMGASSLLPGDLAVTYSGIHIMAYLGDGGWIEADPTAGRVIAVQAPAEKNAWFNTRMRIVRWRLFTP